MAEALLRLPFWGLVVLHGEPFMRSLGEDGEWPGLKKGLAPAGAAGRHLTGYPRETVI